MKRNVRISPHTLFLALILLIAIALLVCLAYYNWPLPNSDESIIGLMALHIQRNGEHPLLFYGQDYMGSLQAYIGAFLFNLFGSSVFVLRLGMIVLYVAFMLCLYGLCRQLYTRYFALFMVFLFAFGSTAMLSRQLSAIGGYPEILFFSTASLLITLYLALHPYKERWQENLGRYLLYILWGGAVGLGLWSDTLIVPWIVCSCLVLLLSWREIIFRGAIVPLLMGLLIGSTPLIIHNLHVVSGHDSISTILSQMGHVPLTISVLYTQFFNTFTVSLPIISGNPVCHSSEYGFLQYWGFEQHWAPQCTNIGIVWSLGFCTLWFISALLAFYSLMKIVWPLRRRHWSVEEYRHFVLVVVWLILLLGIVANILPYLRSVSPINGPGTNSRYLMGVWIGYPALLWPLWLGCRRFKQYISRSGRMLSVVRQGFCASLLMLIVALFMVGSALSLRDIPEARTASTQEQTFIDTLLTHNIKHVYGDYWVVYRMAFTSDERIIGVSLAYNYRNSHALTLFQNKYIPYIQRVESDPYAAYIIPEHSDVAYRHIVEKRIQLLQENYQIFEIDGYLVYQPIHS
ncbi:ArnT family glycosyltransferase [Dictyobacter arantiisoli]|uniref:Glycosyltransferase RgtA/B/C/D-like domain-containing protein n=1 Tax=Dictyobacter arantiisoli TaxID=2014874 RepID=A0A5A5TFG1_9CHLR|nr:glycosyltransferase family 39 protein [Dictyobacter arantiisoli]GCF10311.1 hypothetical protein KDI_38750 [Dictyobacter arantiisoli]